MELLCCKAHPLIESSALRFLLLLCGYAEHNSGVSLGPGCFHPRGFVGLLQCSFWNCSPSSPVLLSFQARAPRYGSGPGVNILASKRKRCAASGRQTLATLYSIPTLPRGFVYDRMLVLNDNRAKEEEKIQLKHMH